MRLLADRMAGVVAILALGAAGPGIGLAALRAMAEERPPVTEGPLAVAEKGPDDVSWGQTVNGLQIGLTAKQAKFESGKPLEFIFKFRCAGPHAKALKLEGAKSVLYRRPPLIFTRKDAQDTPRAISSMVSLEKSATDDEKRFDLDLSAGAEESVPLAFKNPGLLAFLDATPLLPTRESIFPDERALLSYKNKASALPVGKYSVRGYFFSEDEAGYWKGKAATGAYEIEIVAPEKQSGKSGAGAE